MPSVPAVVDSVQADGASSAPMGDPKHQPAPGVRRGSAGPGLFLVPLLLLCLFHGVLLPGYIVFSNDGPLGVISAESSRLPEGFLGVWQDLNWLGASSPAAMPNFTQIFGTLAGDPALFSKVYAPVSLALLGFAAVFLCRRLGFAPQVSSLVGIAAALNSNFFSYACWGLPGRALAAGAILCALGFAYRPGPRPWVSMALAGFAVGLNVSEAADSGALLSLYFAAAVLWDLWGGFRREDAPAAPRTGALAGVARLALAVGMAGWMAFGSIDTLVNTSVKGVAATSQEQSAEQRWDFLTGWSFPKAEVLRIAIPGVLGYRMDTEDGGAYWGGVGPDGDARHRFSGSGEYAGVLVLVVAAWAVWCSFTRVGSPFTDRERHRILFWALASLVSLLLAFGRHAPFYSWIVQLPFFREMRIPMKFLHGFHLSVLVLFAHGLEAIARAHMGRFAPGGADWSSKVRSWWRAAATPAPERRFLLVLGVLTGAAILGFAAYFSCRPSVVAHLGPLVGADQAVAVARHSLGEVGLFVLLLGGSALVVLLVFSGVLSGASGSLAWWILGGLLAVDLYRASTPWVVHYDYRRRYRQNVVVEYLARDPALSRVTCRFLPTSRQMLVADDDGMMPAVHNLWLEHHFQRYNVQTLDIIQAPRMPALDQAFLKTLEPTDAEMSRGDFRAVGRLWQLTATRYILAARAFEARLNQAFTVSGTGFAPRLGFDLGLKPDADRNRLRPDDLDAAPNPAGRYALFEVTGSLPRFGLFARWEVSTSDTAMLSRLRDPAFDPAGSVILASAPGLAAVPGATNGTARLVSYSPRRIVLETRSSSPQILLDNGRWHEDWKVLVDGRPAALLRANHLMRAVELPPGDHAVELRFQPDTRPLWVSVSALAVALGLAAFTVVSERRGAGGAK